MISKEDQAAQRLAHRQAARASRLQSDGLARLREGKAPTKVQLPFIQQYILSQDDEVKALNEDLANERADRNYTERLYHRVISKWNTVFDVLRLVGIELYAKADDNHGWHGEVGESKGGQEGYGSFEEALRAALEWRIALVAIR